MTESLRTRTALIYCAGCVGMMIRRNEFKPREVLGLFFYIYRILFSKKLVRLSITPEAACILLIIRYSELNFE